MTLNDPHRWDSAQLQLFILTFKRIPFDVLFDILFIYCAVCFDILFLFGLLLDGVCVCVDLVSGPVGPGGPRALLSSP